MYSVKMRASRKTKEDEKPQHVSGAERLIPSTGGIYPCLKLMLDRALNHSLGPVDAVNFSINKIDTEINVIKSLPIVTVKVTNKQEGLHIAKIILEELNINQEVIKKSMNWLAVGGAPGGYNMRGAMLFDIYTSRRVEDDPFGGVRATNFDMTEASEKKLSEELNKIGAYNSRTRDALVLATKVCNFPGIIAELCCADDPSYSGGYVASKQRGYIRINHMKSPDHNRGGRIIFLDSRKCNIEQYKHYLKNTVVQVNDIGNVSRVYLYEELTNGLMETAEN
ncbi:MAG TPA: 6-carboxyhexanoate--CoA ligase [Patescibacteria group bacterium]|nr:6-carboxyhexanoate--CoA ligase [Gammaproteobacteria bacterium]HWA51490.1 6-carboxyhexanoate--CoA ligase [Patescibacteria group bacterium]